jgi:hypothetical protein
MPFSACTSTILNTINWCAAYVLNRPSSGVAGVTNEPALTNANLILSTILAPPFAWQWNRSVVTFNTVIGQSDYTQSLPTFGWIEKATVEYTIPTNPPIVELEIASLLTASGKPNRPFKISVANDDNAGNITFRLMAIPDQVYNVTIIYQNAPIRVTSLSQTWAPIPDKYNFLYERAMLAHLHGMYDAATYVMELQLFFRQLVGCSEGLSDSAKAIFLEDRLAQLRTETASQNSSSGTIRKAQ